MVRTPAPRSPWHQHRERGDSLRWNWSGPFRLYARDPPLPRLPKPYLADNWSGTARTTGGPRSRTVSGASNTISAPARPVVAAWTALSNALACRNSRGCGPPQHLGSSCEFVQGRLVCGLAGFQRPATRASPGDNRLEQLQPFAPELWRAGDQSREDLTPPCQIRHEPAPQRITGGKRDGMSMVACLAAKAAVSLASCLDRLCRSLGDETIGLVVTQLVEPARQAILLLELGECVHGQRWILGTQAEVVEAG
jgi:hypothetical protein